MLTEKLLRKSTSKKKTQMKALYTGYWIQKYRVTKSSTVKLRKYQRTANHTWQDENSLES